MKRILSLLIASVALQSYIWAQSTNDILNILVENGTIQAAQADSVRAEAAIKQQEADSKKKSFQVTSSKALKIGGYTQLRYRVLEEDKKADGFDVRNVYLDFRGDITPYISYRFQPNFAGTPKVVDAYTEVKLLDYLNFTIGQQPLPFSLNSITSNTKLELPDRAVSSDAFSARNGDIVADQGGRDIGIAASGGFIKKDDYSIIEYRVGVFNGSGINRTDLNEAKDIVGRLVLQPIKGLSFGGSYYLGKTADSAVYASDAKVTGLNSKALGDRERYGVELSYEYSIAHLRAEYLSGKDGAVNKSGYYVQAGAFVIPNTVQLVGRYDFYDKNTDKDDDAATAIVAGANYFINKNTLLQLAYTVKKEEVKSIDNNIATLQLQVSF